MRTKKWTTFTYYSPKIRAVTNVLKNTNLRIAFKTTPTLRQLTRQRQQAPTPDHDRSGIYKIVGYCRVAWCTTTVLQWQQYLLTAIRFMLSKKQKERREAGTGTELDWFYSPMRSPFIWSAELVYRLWLVRINWPVIGRNKLTCDWPEWPVAWGTKMGR